MGDWFLNLRHTKCRTGLVNRTTLLSAILDVFHHQHVVRRSGLVHKTSVCETSDMKGRE